MTTGSITTYAGADGIGGIAGLAVRAGHALEDWGRRIAQPATREQLEQRNAVEREARAAVIARGDAHTGVYQLLR
jgi:hypothetical protein